MRAACGSPGRAGLEWGDEIWLTSGFQAIRSQPVVTPDMVPRANSIHNSAIVRYGDGFAGVFRVDETDFCYRMHTGSAATASTGTSRRRRWIAQRRPEVVMTDHSYDPRLVEQRAGTT